MTTRQAGTRPPTSKDVAALAGVSQSTVSFVINGKNTVSEATRRRVEEAMRKLNYQPNAGARTLKTNRTNIIALFVEMSETIDANETTPYIDAIVRSARARDYDVIITTTHDGVAALKRMAGKSICDGFILMDVSREDPRIPIAAELSQPVTLVGRATNARGLDCVDADARKAALLAVDELADTGHHHVTMVGTQLGSDPNEYNFVDEFYNTAHQRADERGLGFSIVQRLGEGWPGIEKTVDQLLLHADDRLGIIVRQPQPTEWLLRTLRRHDVIPGQDVSVVSYCSDYAATSFEWQVTNVSTTPERLSERAAGLLFDRLEGNRDRDARCELIAPAGITRRATTIDWNARD
ncbi:MULTISPECIES: LacI family DNA-binding transcriptional regulator [Bifidobacterium]|uniref:LacI family DNA-binding transcriptional regulator n=1 Tax=Bifidobacterium TaxID=1678 RepID=UPI001BDD3056|nr:MULTISPECIES: LacI family DNA-binding transcriptional regulator [Bifidobacterium]MBT1170052.1 LacI family DNA-binding transcriptional regulator [Bifidobacterium sp. SO4]MBW3089430.1 LacI family DNA-binding transcriptional regulator [Bifidobacterium miconisargentati]